ncbi:thiamine pyrophosphate-binding protein [Thalassomonas actiniarum]|uniref:Thiamine pyrophosphate-binding protein n=1 Tax=Thalassomonas actiniarum TaxID=485447 RepID=A0AAE9YXT9_9GAMM|nr:thiamine pyrophosphate-binding protein [Thalassomonas actiniarum]WDE02344.1 thiamine pyrophosphate-binding protein [Thalassomonas actiniarum]
MKRTAAYLVRYALEQLNISHTFGIPGVHNTEIYDELDKSELIEPVLVTHEGYGAFMADAVSRSSDSTGTLVIVPAAGATHAASGIGEASLDGIPMLVISGGVRSDSRFAYQLHDMDQHALMKPITKKTYKISRHDQVVSTIFQAHQIANQGEPGPVFIEIPVNLQLDKGEVGELPEYIVPAPDVPADQSEAITRAAKLLAEAKNPGIFLGWGAVDASQYSEKIAEMLNAPVATSLQGLSAFNARHPLHTGMGFGPAAVPAAVNAFKNCDCLLAVGTRFAEIATGSFGVTVPDNLIHLDINPEVFSANYPAKVTLAGDAGLLLPALEKALAKQTICPKIIDIAGKIAQDKAAYIRQWLAHDSGDKVNPALFFQQLRASLDDDAYIIADDGNHTFLTAELMPCYRVKHFFSPTDFNCMGYATPAVIGTKLANPDNQVVGIIGDGAFLMSYTELFTAAARALGAIFTVFSDGELAQISQAQTTPYNKKTCSQLPNIKIKAMVEASGCQYLRIDNNRQVRWGLSQALALAKENIPVVLDVNIDYSKKTCFTRGIIKTNLKRMPLPTKARMISRALWRRV